MGAALPPSIERELCLRSFEHFARRAWAVHHGRPPVWEWPQRAICQHLQALAEGRIKKLGICIPPGYGKSFFASVFFPAWLWACEGEEARPLQSPSLGQLWVSGIGTLALRDSWRAHDICVSEWYQTVLRPAWRFDRKTESKADYRTSEFGERYSRSTGQKITGFRGRLIGVDDPLDAGEAHSDCAALTDHVTWFDEALSTREELGVDTSWLLIMQRLHDRDLAGVLQKRDRDAGLTPATGGWDWLILPAEYDPAHQCRTSIGWADPRTEPGELLSQRLLPAWRLASKKLSLGPRKYAAQYLQRPPSGGGGIFSEGMVRYWHRVSLPSKWDALILSIDSAFKDTKDADYIGLQVWGSLGAERYLLFGRKDKLSTPGLIRAIREVYASSISPYATIIELAANGPEVIRLLKREIPGLQAVSHQGETKESRAEAVLPQWAAEQVYLPAIEEPEGQYVRDDFLPELLAFPEAPHDDQVDAMSQALIYLLHRR